MAGMCMAQSMGIEARRKDPSLDLRVLVRDRELRNQKIFLSHTEPGDIHVSMWMGSGIFGYVCTGKPCKHCWMK